MARLWVSNFMYNIFLMAWQQMGGTACHGPAAKKSHSALVPYLMLWATMHHFVTEMSTCGHISVTKWCIVGYLSNALWDLRDGTFDLYIVDGLMTNGWWAICANQCVACYSWILTGYWICLAKTAESLVMMTGVDCVLNIYVNQQCNNLPECVNNNVPILSFGYCRSLFDWVYNLACMWFYGIVLEYQWPILLILSILFMAWISNYIHYSVWDENTYLFPNFNSLQLLKFGNG